MGNELLTKLAAFAVARLSEWPTWLGLVAIATGAAIFLELASLERLAGAALVGFGLALALSQKTPPPLRRRPTPQRRRG